MKRLIFEVFYCLRLHILVRRIFQKGKVTILLFHELPLHNAKKIIRFLNENYAIITLEDYIRHREEGSGHRLPNYPLVLTFDDGRKSNMELIDIFKEFKNKPTIYVCSDNEEQDGFPLFNEADFKIAKAPFDLQGHTISHPNLKEISEEAARTEIGRSKIDLEMKLGHSITSFAYPYGKYGDRDVALVKENGYTNAVTVDFGFNDQDTDIFRLKRICISDQPTVAETAIKTCGFWGFLKGKHDAYSR